MNYPYFFLLLTIMNSDFSKFIIYACPTGNLNIQIENYFDEAIKLCGKNKAHNYMPHCTLTGFFSDRLSSISYYIDALEQAYFKAKSNHLSLNVEIEKLTFNDDWHGLELKAEGLKKAIALFNNIENSPTRTEDIRLKQWLHLSLAYGFDFKDRNNLKDLALKNINIESDVSWELRFYQKNQAWTWNCLQSWKIE